MAPHDPPSETPRRNEPAGAPDGTALPALVGFDLDFTAHEIERRAQVLAALGPDWDPIEALHGEEQAYDLPYCGLDAEQQRLYDDLVTAGVLPRCAGGLPELRPAPRSRSVVTSGRRALPVSP